MKDGAKIPAESLTLVWSVVCVRPGEIIALACRPPAREEWKCPTPVCPGLPAGPSKVMRGVFSRISLRFFFFFPSLVAHSGGLLHSANSATME